jgi:hypothetical protein
MDMKSSPRPKANPARGAAPQSSPRPKANPARSEVAVPGIRQMKPTKMATGGVVRGGGAAASGKKFSGSY